MARIDVCATLSKVDPMTVRLRLKTFEHAFDFVSPEQQQVIDTLAKLYSLLDVTENFYEIIESELNKLNVDSGAIIGILEWICQ